MTFGVSQCFVFPFILHEKERPLLQNQTLFIQVALMHSGIFFNLQMKKYNSK